MTTTHATLDRDVTSAPASPSPTPSKTAKWTGRVISALPVLMLLMGSAMSLARTEVAVKGTIASGYPEKVMIPLGVTSLVCTLLYAFPRTAVLGAILLTGYLGGAVATHVRLSEPFFMPILVGVLVWLGLFLRDPRLRALVPLRKI